VGAVIFNLAQCPQGQAQRNVSLGSGKKHKRCCGRGEGELSRTVAAASVWNLLNLEARNHPHDEPQAHGYVVDIAQIKMIGFATFAFRGTSMTAPMMERIIYERI
jgi:hypothetical protein